MQLIVDPFRISQVEHSVTAEQLASQAREEEFQSERGLQEAQEELSAQLRQFGRQG